MTGPETKLALEPLLGGLARHRVRHIVHGSVAALAYGVVLIPNDLDIAPDLDLGNLRRLARFLAELGAKPKHEPGWTAGPTQEQCNAWVQDPATVENLDHRFVTRFGEFDVVPTNAGTYVELIARAIPARAFRLDFLLAHPDDVVAFWRKWNRAKDRKRLGTLIAASAGIGVGTGPLDVADRLRWIDV